MPHPENIEELLPFLNTCLYYEFNQKKNLPMDIYTYKWYYQILFCTESIEDINWNSEDQKYSNILSENLIQEYHVLQGVIHYPYEDIIF